MGLLRILVHILILRPLLKLFFGVNVAGKDNLHDLDRFIIIANHNSHLDVFLLFYVLPVRHILKTHPVAAEEYFARWKLLFRLVDCLLKPIWIVRGKRVADPLRGMKERLGSGHNIIIFPEGTRGSPGELAGFKTGIGRLAVEYRDIPIVPVFLTGPEKAFPRRTALPLPIWNNITIGPPQVFKGDSRDITSALEEMVRELSESETAHRHIRRSRPTQPVEIAVLGIDGSGKSTLSRTVAQQLSSTRPVALVTDSLELYEHGDRKEVQPLLKEKVRESLGRYAKTAKSLKIYKIPKMAELLLRDHIMGEVGRWYLPEIVVMDGCPLLNMVAWSVLYKKEKLEEDIYARAIGVLTGRDRETPRSDRVFTDFPELLYLKRMKLNALKLPDIVLFLDVSPSVACARISSRGERRQVHETEQKLGELRAAYIMVCEIVRRHWHVSTITINGEQDLDKVSATALEFVRRSMAAEGG